MNKKTYKTTKNPNKIIVVFVLNKVKGEKHYVRLPKQQRKGSNAL